MTDATVDAPTDDGDGEAGRGDPAESRRPALRKLTSDLRDMRQALADGFESRRTVLVWLRKLTVRTLGELPDSFYVEVGRQYRGEVDASYERTLLAALLDDDARRRPMDPAVAQALRERLAATVILPAELRAFRELRKSAGEYLKGDEEESDTGHNPQLQRYVAMRPTLDEFTADQERALQRCLDGLSDRAAILDWGDDVLEATHGEMPREFITRCHREESAARVLTGDAREDARARETLAAYYLLPYFNRGVRDLTGRSGEEPHADHERTEVPLG